MLVPRPGHVDRKVLGAFLEVRAVLDAEMASLAARNRTQADIKAMRSCLARLDDLLHDASRYSLEVNELARLVARASKNPLYLMLAAYNVRVASELESAFAVTRPASREHLNGLHIFVELIARGEAEGARRAVTDFHAWATPRILAAAALASGEPLARVLKER